MGKLFKRYRRQPLACLFCDVVLANTQNLEGHMNTHTQEKPYFCLYCDATFGQKSGQIYHQKTVHLKIKKKCVKCNQKFHVGSTIHAHTKKCMGKRSRSKCLKKNVISARKIGFTKKRDGPKGKKVLFISSPPVMEGEENHFPNKAEHVTTNVNNTQRMKYPEYLVVQPQENNFVHPPFKLHNATIGSDQQRWDPLFFLHMNRYEMEGPTTTAPENPSSKNGPNSVKLEADDDNVTCRQCGKVYSNKWNLRKHLRLHGGDKQYTCHFCQRKFFEKVKSKLLNFHCKIK